jgi:hypothetical protein
VKERGRLVKPFWVATVITHPMPKNNGKRRRGVVVVVVVVVVARGDGREDGKSNN